MKTEREMPFDVLAFVADTMGMTAAEAGSYLYLILDYWIHARPLPNDDHYLAQVARCSEEDWPARRAVLEQRFSVHNGTWTQKRSEDNIRKSLERQGNINRASAAGVEARRALGQIPSGQPSVGPSVSPVVQRISMERELERVLKRLEAVRNQGTSVAGGQTTFTTAQRAELTTLRQRRDELKKNLGVVA